MVFAASIPIAAWNASVAEYSWVSLFVLQSLLYHRGRARSTDALDGPVG
jgi:hypothetical protein